jgi:hypothetical protein
VSLTKDERTTTINFDDGTETAEVVTYSRPVITALRKNEGAIEVEQLSHGGVVFRIPKKLVSFRNPRKGSGRTWTPEQRAAAGERMKKARAAKT